MSSPGSPNLLLSLGGLALLSGCPRAEDCTDELAASSRPPAPDFSGLDESAPPQVIASVWLDSRVLELQFSEPLEPLGAGSEAIDPLRFRVLAANISTDEYYDCALYTSYFVPRQGYFQAIYPDLLWQAPEDPALLRLRMNTPLPCSSGAGAGLMLVYTNDPNPGYLGSGIVRDLGGTAMPDLGPMWAISGLDSCVDRYDYGYAYPCYSLNQRYSGSFPLLTSLLPIPCPA